MDVDIESKDCVKHGGVGKRKKNEKGYLSVCIYFIHRSVSEPCNFADANDGLWKIAALVYFFSLVGPSS